VAEIAKASSSLIGDRIGETYALYGLGVVRQRAGRLDNADTTLQHALSLARQVGERLVVVRRKAQTPLLQYAYKAPAAADPRGPAVNLLLSILVDGDASRLHRSLVEDKRVAIEVSGHWQEGFDPGLLWLYLTLPEGSDPAEVQIVLDAELADVVKNGVTAAELSRAKNLTAAGFWKKLATIDGKAQLLGEYEVFHGDWAKLFTAPAQFEKVTREQIHAVARDLLDRRRRTAGVLMPTSDDADESANADIDEADLDDANLDVGEDVEA